MVGDVGLQLFAFVLAGGASSTPADMSFPSIALALGGGVVGGFAHGGVHALVERRTHSNARSGFIAYLPSACQILSSAKTSEQIIRLEHDVVFLERTALELSRNKRSDRLSSVLTILTQCRISILQLQVVSTDGANADVREVGPVARWRQLTLSLADAIVALDPKTKLPRTTVS